MVIADSDPLYTKPLLKETDHPKQAVFLQPVIIKEGCYEVEHRKKFDASSFRI